MIVSDTTPLNYEEARDRLVNETSFYVTDDALLESEHRYHARKQAQEQDRKTGRDRASRLRTLGAVLCRAGRIEDAIRWLEEARRGRNGVDEPFDWPFLAMAHQRLGHGIEARRWLGKLRDRQPSAVAEKFWYELALRLLRREAEAVILHDPVFPADPFAH